MILACASWMSPLLWGSKVCDILLTKLGAILCHLINTLSSFSVEIEEVVVVYGAIKAVNVIIACQHHGKTLCIIVGCKAQRDSRERPLSDVKDTYLHQSIVLSSDSLCPFYKICLSYTECHHCLICCTFYGRWTEIIQVNLNKSS